MDLTTPYTLTIAELKWLFKAASTDPHRHRLGYAEVVTFTDGNLYIVTTDTHRMHLVKLGKVEQSVSATIDIRRLIFEMMHSKTKLCDLSVDLLECKIYNGQGKNRSYASIPYSVLPTLTDKYPNAERVVPSKMEPLASFPVLNFKYLSDAMSMGVAEFYAVQLSCESGTAEMRPIVVSPRTGDRWKSIVMPMSKK